MGGRHGTTNLWVRLSPQHILVAHDSRLTQRFKAGNPNPNEETKRGESTLVLSDDYEKFVMLSDQVFATAAGDADRFEKMTTFVREELIKRRTNPSLIPIAHLANEYFQTNPPIPTKFEAECDVYMCAWVKEQSVYDVFYVGDDVKQPVLMGVDENVFGCGSGSLFRLQEIECGEIPKDVETLFKHMFIASAEDPCTGGPITVHSFGVDFIHTMHKDSLIARLLSHDKMYTDMFFDKKHMFVITSRSNEHNLTPWDLKTNLNGSFDPAIVEKNIVLLSFSKRKEFMCFLVRLSSEDNATKWFDFYLKFCGSSLVHSGVLINKDEGYCAFYLARASGTMLKKFETMVSVLDLVKS